MKTYLRHRIFNVLEVKDLIALEYLDFEGKYRDYVEDHDFWELCFVEDGDVLLSLNGRKISLESKTVFLIPPDQSHSYFSSTGNQTRAFVICFESSSQALKSLGGIPVFVGDTELISMKCIIDECSGTFCMNEEEHLEVLPTPNFGGQQAILLQLEYLLISLLRRLSSEKNAEVVFLNDEQFYADLAKVVIRYLKSNIGRRLSLQDVCNRFNYSRSFLCRTFKEQTGESLINCFNRLKIEEAKRLLSDTEMSVVKVARELGFSEAKYFGAVFKSHTGFSPSEYRDGIKK